MTSHIGPRALGILISLVKMVEKVAQTKVIREGVSPECLVLATMDHFNEPP